MRFLPFLLFLFFAGRAFAQDTVTTRMPNAEIAIGGGILFPQPHKYNRVVATEPVPGPKLSIGVNFNLNKKNRPLYMSVGGRIMRGRFHAMETHYVIDYMIGNKAFYTIGRGRFGYTILSVGVPVKINYMAPLGKWIRFTAGIGVFPCLQNNLEPNPLRAYAEAYAGLFLSNRWGFVIDFNRSVLDYPYNHEENVEYTLWGLMFEVRYAIQNLKIY